MNENRNENKKRVEYSYSDLKGIHRAVPILIAALAVIIFAGYITDETGFGHAISMIFMGLFGAGAWAIPALLIIHAVFYAEDLGRDRIVSRIIFSVVTVLVVSVIHYDICFWDTWRDEAVFAPVRFFNEQSAGGFIGSMLAFLLIKVFGPVGIITISVAVAALYVTFLFAGTNNAVSRVFLLILEYAASGLAVIERGVVNLVARCKELIDQKKQRQIEERQAELIDDEFFKVDNGMQRMEIKELGIKESKSADDIESNPTLHSKVYMKSAVMDESDGEGEDVKKAKDDSAERKKNSASERATEKFRQFSFDYNIDTSSEAKPETENSEESKADEREQVQRTQREAFGLDEKAENVFTKDFDPFDFNEAETVATRRSSRAPITEKIAPIFGEAVDLDQLTEEDVRRIREKEALAKKMAEQRAENERRRLEFEQRKQMIVNQYKSATVQSAEPQNEASAPRMSTTYSAPTFTDYSSHSAKEDIFTVKEQRLKERQYAAEQASVSVASEEQRFDRVQVDPPRENGANSANMETNVYNEPKKTVTFNVSNESFRHEPQNNGAASYTYEKVQRTDEDEDVSRNDDTEKVAFAVAQAVAMKNPMYARSENVTNGSYSYTVTSDDDEKIQSIDPIESADLGAVSGSAEDALYAERSMMSPEPQRLEAEEYGAASVENNTVSNGYDIQNEDGVTSNYHNVQRNEGGVASNGYSVQMGDGTVSNGYGVPRGENGGYGASMAKGRGTEAINELSFNEADAGATYKETEVQTSELSSDISSTFSAVESVPTNDVEDDDDGFGWTEDIASPSFIDEDEDEDAIDGFESVEEDFDQRAIPPEEQNPEVIRMREQFPFLAEEDEDSSDEPCENGYGEDVLDDNTISDEDEDIDDEDDVPFDNSFIRAETGAARSSVSADAAKPMPPVPAEKPAEKPKADFTNYKLPSLDMLISPPTEEYDYSEETQEKANMLISALESFNVTASIKGVDRGPRITRYEVVPARGVKVNSVLSLSDDIALNLAANSIRMEAPIPGKSAIGVEVPNATSTTVYLRELVETVDFQNNPSKTAVCIGKDVAGTPVFGDIAKMPHLLVAGATGMGKSVCMNSFMISLLYKAKPDEVKFIMIDPKKVEFKRYNGIPHLLIPVVAEAKQAAGALMWAVGEMERRYGLIESLYVSNIDMYNAKVKDNPSLGEVLPRIIIVIDEFADLMLQVKDPVEKLVMSLAQKARAAGIHLIIGTQRPSVQVITGTIKANIPSRISCKVASYQDSRTVLECSGAEKLLDKGDMLFSFPGAIKPIRVQGAFVSDGELDKILSYVKEQSGGANYDDAVLEEINKAAQKCAKKSGDDGDDESDHDDYSGGEGYLNNKQFLESVEIAVSQGQISTSLLQRRISIGFGKAAKFIDIMEDMGIVGEKNGTKPRQVLITKEEWREKLSRTTYEDY